MQNYLKKFFSDIYVDVAIAIVIFMAFFALSEFDGSIHQIVGILVFVGALAIWILARVELGNSYSVLPRAKELVQPKIYSKVRHPMYVFSSLAALGLVIMLNTFIFYLLWAVLVLLQIGRAKKEEEVLKEKFSGNWEEYKNKTWF